MLAKKEHTCRHVYSCAAVASERAPCEDHFGKREVESVLCEIQYMHYKVYESCLTQISEVAAAMAFRDIQS